MVKTIEYDAFNGDEAEKIFFLLKPTCFIVLGKPGSGKSTLSKKFARFSKCVLISVPDAIQHAIEIETKLGLEAKELLLKGEAVPDDLSLNILKERLLSPEVQHYGYILDGFPPVSSDTNIVDKQFQFLKHLPLKPDYIINLRIQDMDVLTRRRHLKVDPVTNKLYTKEFYMKNEDEQIVPKTLLLDNEDEEVDEEEEGEENEEEEGDELEEEEPDPDDPEDMLEELEMEPEISANIVKRLIKRSDEFLENLQLAMKDYRGYVLPKLNHYISKHNQQKVIELNANLPAKLVFRNLKLRLDAVILHHAMTPVRLLGGEEQEEIADDTDVEDMLRTLAALEMIAPGFRWRRSRWGRLCPVSLLEGQTVVGNPEFSVSFLDKMYLLSSAEALDKFIENPRRYIMPPQPVPPCKMIVLGAPLSGKTTLSHKLAARYNSKVFNVDDLIGPKITEAKQQQDADAQEKRLARAIEQVKADEENERLARTQLISDEELSTPEESKEEEKEVEVDENHPMVKKLLEEQIEAEENNTEVQMTSEDYIDCLEQAMMEMYEGTEKGPSAGGWILDNFPHTKEQFTLMVDRGIIPDDVIVFREESNTNEILVERWHEKNAQASAAAATEKNSSENKEKEETIDGKSEETNDGISEETIEGISEETNEGKSEETNDRISEETKDGKSEETKDGKSEETIEGISEETNEGKSEETNDGISEEIKDGKTEEQKQFEASLTEFDRNWTAIQSTIRNTNNLEPIVVFCSIPKDEAFHTITKEVEASLQYQGWEYTGMDQDEEEEDYVVDEEMEEEDDENDDPNKKKPFGETAHFCPVMLKEENVLWPGSPDCAVKYKERVYFLSSYDNRDQFLESPETYLPQDKPLAIPPVRLLLLGPKGSGKTLHGRLLAKKFGVLHISFKDRLQELILHKTMKRIGPDFEFEEENEEEEEEDEKNEDEDKDDDGEGEKKPADEEPLPLDLNDFEENIHNNILEGEPLEKDILDLIVAPWWKEEPFKSKGFILEGFPRTPEEARYLQQNGLFPDGALMFAVEEKDICSRLMPPIHDRWKIARDKRIAKREKKQLKKLKFREEERLRRKREKLREIEVRKADKLNSMQSGEDSDEGGDEEDDAADLDELINIEMLEEFGEMEEEEEEEETEEEAIDRINSELADKYEDEMTVLEGVQETLEDLLIPRINIAAGHKPHITQYNIKKVLRSQVEFRDSLFDRCQSISQSLAKKLLNAGYKKASRFAKWDPVKLHDGDSLPPFTSREKPSFPVVYRHYIYFMSSEENKERFMQSPQTFLTQASPKPLVPVKIAIIGPPKSGKTTLANRFVKEHGLMRLSIGEAVRKVMMTHAQTELVKEIQDHLLQGSQLPDELAIQALEICLLDPVCMTRGFVLDGYPVTIKQMELLQDRDIIPYKVILLDVTDQEIMQRGIRDRKSANRAYPIHDSHTILAIKIACHRRENGPINKFYREQYKNLYAIDGHKSKWWVYNEVKEEVQRAISNIQTYIEQITEGHAASIMYMCVTPKEMHAQLGEFGEYCPVTLAEQNELVDCSHDTSHDLVAEFRGKYYKFPIPENMELFLKTPCKYIAPLAPVQLPEPDGLPKKRSADYTKKMFPAKIELQGYCPVTYYHGNQTYEAIVPGDPNLIIEYRKKFYSFATEHFLEKFMRSPKTYASLVLPKKVPPRREPIIVSGLPMLGYMEQTVSTAVVKALTAVGCLKPKYPYLSAKRSALLYVAYHLKAHNPKASEYVRQKYKRRLKEFEQHCDLICYLSKVMRWKYMEPEDRPLDFDRKLTSFRGLAS